MREGQIICKSTCDLSESMDEYAPSITLSLIRLYDVVIYRYVLTACIHIYSTNVIYMYILYLYLCPDANDCVVTRYTVYRTQLYGMSLYSMTLHMSTFSTYLYALSMNKLYF